jgi:hypothetical protein
MAGRVGHAAVLQQVGQRHAQRIGQAPDHGDGGVGLRALDLRQHALADTGAARQFVQRQRLLLAQRGQRGADAWWLGGGGAGGGLVHGA